MISIPNTRVFCDTSFFYASIDPEDENHLKAKEIAKRLNEKKIALYCTEAIIFETITLLRYRFSYEGALNFLKKIKPELNVVRLDKYYYSKVDFWFEKLSRDKLLSYCDVISYVAVREKLDDIHAFLLIEILRLWD